MVSDTRILNRSSILTSLLLDRPSSRKDLATKTFVSAATVGRVVDELIDENVLLEIDERVVKARGRRAILLDLVQGQSFAVGVDLGASQTHIVVADRVCTPVSALSFVTPIDHSPEVLARWVGDRVRDAAGQNLDRIENVVVGIPGAVSSVDGTVSNAPILTQIEDPRFSSELRSALPGQVDLENDVNLALTAELRFGAGRHIQTASMLTLGDGLGGAIAIEGRILRGRHGLVGEFGQLPAGPSGERLESLVTGPGILRRAKLAGVALAEPSLLFQPSPSREVAALRCQFDQALSVALTAVAVASEPEVIILGGWVSESLGTDLAPYRDALTESLRIAPALAMSELNVFSVAAGGLVSGLRSIYTKLGVEETALFQLPIAPDFARKLGALSNANSV